MQAFARKASIYMLGSVSSFLMIANKSPKRTAMLHAPSILPIGVRVKSATH